MGFVLFGLFVILPIVLVAVVVRLPRTGAALPRAGLMELQNLLEPERKIEILRELDDKAELLVQLDPQGG
jgi:hypothetical protein